MQFYYKPGLGFYRATYILPGKRQLGRLRSSGAAYKHLFKGWGHATAQIENRRMELGDNAIGYN
jgi:hypothetical protein